MANSRVNPALEKLRAATADVHRALEATLEVAQPDAGAGAYARYAAAVFGWLEPLEAPLWSPPWPAAIAAAARTGKVRWVESDLRAHGLGDAEISALPRQRELPPLGSVAERFGVAYVVEGSQLGGQVLLRRLAPRLSPLPARFLEGYGAAGGQRWRAFVAELGSQLGERAELERAAESARCTFELVRGWFSSRGVA